MQAPDGHLAACQQLTLEPTCFNDIKFTFIHEPAKLDNWSKKAYRRFKQTDQLIQPSAALNEEHKNETFSWRWLQM